jgi:hypothetical protein
MPRPTLAGPSHMAGGQGAVGSSFQDTPSENIDKAIFVFAEIYPRPCFEKLMMLSFEV